MKNILNKLKRKVYHRRGRKRSRKSKLSFFNLKGKRKGASGGKYILQRSLILFGLILLVGLLVSWTVFSLFKVVTFSIPRAYKDDETIAEREWKGEGRINILVVGMDERDNEFGFADLLMIVMIDPQDPSIGIFNINPDTKVFYPQLGKDIRLRNAYNHGLLDNKEAPISFLRSGVEDLLSINVNKYILADREGIKEVVSLLGGVYVNNHKDVFDEDVVASGESFSLTKGNYRLSENDYLSFCSVDDDGVDHKFIRQISALEGLLKRSTSYVAFMKLPLFLEGLSKHLYTDLTKKEMIRLFYELTRFKDLNTAYMQSSSIQMADNGVGYYPIIEQLDLDIQKVFIDPEVGKEQARVEIFNSTSTRGLATFRARWLRNVGVDVIRVGDSAVIYKETTIFTREKGAYPNTIDAVKKTFDEEIKIREGELPEIVTTGDVIIILGENINTE